MRLLENNVAVVTGASRGIGKAIAIDLAANGCSVVINYTSNDEMANKVLEETNEHVQNNIIYKADVSKKYEVEQMVESIISKFGKIDILVNNAGITRDSLLLRMKEDDWDDVLDVNLKGTFNCLQAVSKIMIKNKKGRIVNISSVIGLEGNAGQANYAASKAGIIGLTAAAAKEFGSRNITVNAIAPGFIATDMTSLLSEEKLEDISRYISLGRIGKPEDIAGLVSFLCSAKASYITGQVIRVDGGLIL